MYENAQIWLQNGASVTVITAPYEKSDIKAKGFISKQKVAGIQLIVIDSGDSNRIPKVLRAFRALVFAMVATYYTLTTKANVLIGSSGPITVGIPVLIAKWLRGRKMIFEVRDLWPSGGVEMGLIKSKIIIKLAFWFERLCYLNSNLVITASPGQEENLSKRFRGLKLHCAPNSSDIYLFDNKQILSSEQRDRIGNKPYYLHIGSLGLIHNVNYWLDVAYHLKNNAVKNNIAFVFIGAGAELEYLQNRVQSDHLENVYFLGLMAKKDLSPWLNCSIGTLFATLNNPVQDTCSPNKVFDSFAAGKFVVQTSEGWIKNLFERADCGVNVSLNNPKGCADSLLKISENKAWQDQMNENAHQLALNDFSRERIARTYYEKMKEL